MSLTPISQYASTASSVPRIAAAKPAQRSTTTSSSVSQSTISGNVTHTTQTSVHTLASGQEVTGHGFSDGQTSQAKSSVNVTYDRLSRQTEINQGAQNKTYLNSFLASYVQNSNSEDGTQSLGSLFKSSA